MNKKLELNLVHKYPSIFKEYGGDETKTCLHWGFECADGWYYLLNRACKNIKEVCDLFNIEFTAEQVKEKFGGLHFYYSIKGNKQYIINKIERYFSKYFYKYKLGNQFNFLRNVRQRVYSTPAETISCIIRKAEEESYKTCEICGMVGKLYGGGWLSVRCEKHK